MAKLNTVKRILKEDFDQKDQALIEKLAFPLNQLIEQLVSAFNKNFTVADNLPFEYKTFTVKVDSGVPTIPLKLKTVVKAKGMIIVSHQNLSNAQFLTGAPYCTFSFADGIITIRHITGLVDALNYSLTALIVS